MEDICKHISQTERRAATAERAANDRYLPFMKDKVGQTFNATISGVKKFGVFVTIGQENVDALLPTSKLPAIITAMMKDDKPWQVDTMD